jgi:hypothetical protein
MGSHGVLGVIGEHGSVGEQWQPKDGKEFLNEIINAPMPVDVHGVTLQDTRAQHHEGSDEQVTTDMLAQTLVLACRMLVRL